MAVTDAAAGALAALDTPCLLLDEARLDANVARMRARLAGLGVAFRPHLKTAKSLPVARRAMTGPGGPAMVSTLREADYFAEGGVTDMIYGVGIAPQKLDRVGGIRRHRGRPRDRPRQPGAGGGRRGLDRGQRRSPRCPCPS